jgi:hypothetical protein
MLLERAIFQHITFVVWGFYGGLESVLMPNLIGRQIVAKWTAVPFLLQDQWHLRWQALQSLRACCRARIICALKAFHISLCGRSLLVLTSLRPSGLYSPPSSVLSNILLERARGHILGVVVGSCGEKAAIASDILISSCGHKRLCRNSGCSYGAFVCSISVLGLRCPLWLAFEACACHSTWYILYQKDKYFSMPTSLWLSYVSVQFCQCDVRYVHLKLCSVLMLCSLFVKLKVFNLGSLLNLAGTSQTTSELQLWAYIDFLCMLQCWWLRYSTLSRWFQMMIQESAFSWRTDIFNQLWKIQCWIE